MADNRDFFTPEQVEEQVAWLRQHPPADPGSQRYSGESQLIEDVQRLYQSEKADARSLEQIWGRLESQGVAAPGPSQTPHHVPPQRPGPSTRSQQNWSPSQASTPAAPARRGLSTRLLAIAAAVLLVVVVSGLVAGLVLVRQHGPVISNQPTTKPGQTTTPAPTPCTTRPTATAEAWFPYVSGLTNFVRGQVMGTINNGPVTTLSDFHYPLGISFENIDKTTSPHHLVWSPDAHYIAAGVTIYQSNLIYPYLIDTTTHATTPVPQPMGTDGLPLKSWPEGRYFAWADNHTLLLFYGSNTQAQGSAGPTYSYDVNTKALTQLPGVQNAAEGIVRCSTLFYLELTPATKEINQDAQNGYTYYEGTALLHRYDLNTHTEIGQPVNIGSTFAQVPGPPDRPSVPLWDVSQDGKLLVYVQSAFWAGNNPVTQQYLLENVDGSAARVIPTNQVPNWTKYFQTFEMSLSPDGQFVAIDANNGKAPIFTLNVVTGAYRAYGNPVAGGGLTEWGGPQWYKDSSSFDVVNTQSTGQSVADPYISRYLLSTPPGADGYVPGNIIAPEAQALALLS